MHLNRTIATLLTSLAMLMTGTSQAGLREDQLAQYASAAKAEAPGFAGFTSERGKLLHTQRFAGGKPDTPACTTCHGKDPRGAGQTPTGKTIEAMAASANPARYADPAKAERELGWKARRGLDEMMRDAWRWQRMNPDGYR